MKEAVRYRVVNRDKRHEAGKALGCLADVGKIYLLKTSRVHSQEAASSEFYIEHQSRTRVWHKGVPPALVGFWVHLQPKKARQRHSQDSIKRELNGLWIHFAFWTSAKKSPVLICS
jgi:hypothetical protein